MAQFSVKEAAKYSLSTYGKHFVLLLSASALVAGSYWFATKAPRFVAEKLGVHQVLDVDMVAMMQQPQGQATDQSTMVLQKVQEVTAKIFTHLQVAPKHLLTLVLLVFLLVWGLYLTLILGLMKLVLTIKDKDSASCKGILSHNMTILLAVILWIALAVAMFCWLVGYCFYGYCIVDKPTIGAREALRMSRDLSRGSRGRLIAAVTFLAALGMIGMFIVNKLMMMGGCACAPEQQRAVAALAVMVVTYPFTMPFFSYIYRSLSVKGR